jgi:hypothetical protein
MKRKITFFISFLSLNFAFAQTKLLTIEDAITKQKTTLAFLISIKKTIPSI